MTYNWLRKKIFSKQRSNSLPSKLQAYLLLNKQKTLPLQTKQRKKKRSATQINSLGVLKRKLTASSIILRVHKRKRWVFHMVLTCHIQLHTQNSPHVIKAIIWSHLDWSLTTTSSMSTVIGTWGTARYPHIPLIFTVSVAQYLKDKPHYLSSLQYPLKDQSHKIQYFINIWKHGHSGRPESIGSFNPEKAQINPYCRWRRLFSSVRFYL